jgi:hypothetical protein
LPTLNATAQNILHTLSAFNVTYLNGKLMQNQFPIKVTGWCTRLDYNFYNTQN